MIKEMSLREIMRCYETLSKLAELKLPVTTVGYPIICMLNEMEPLVLRTLENQKKLLEVYAEKGEDGNPIVTTELVNGVAASQYKILPENLKAANDEFEAFLDKERTTINVRSISMEELNKCDSDSRYDVPTAEQLKGLALMQEVES